MDRSRLHDLLEFHHDKYNRPDWIENDPISIPHRFVKRQDIEIMGFFAAILAWGQRVTTINKCMELSTLMGKAPHDFILNHKEQDLKAFGNFKHRTFNTTDLLYFVSFFQSYYRKHESLEDAFLTANNEMRTSLTNFHDLFFSKDHYPRRTKKHVASPARNSACKRLNMYLRWMVRKDDRGVDFGLWNKLSPAVLMCPLDVHVERTARRLNLVDRQQRDWKTVEELTANLREFDLMDPVKYDFALFGMSHENVSI